MPSGALLMGADYRALGVARSLGRRGIPVWLLQQGGHLVASASRYVCKRLPWPETDDEARIGILADLSDRYQLQQWLLIPTDDSAVALTARYHQQLAGHYKITVPPWEEVEWACDKRLMHRLAEQVGIHAPWTVWPCDRDELATIDCRFPAIVKPAVRMRPSTLAIPKAWFAEDRKALLACYDQAARVICSDDLIVQEVIPGGGQAQFSYAALSRKGHSLASIVARRTRQFPRDFGQFSTYVETMDEPGVSEPAERLLAASGYTGLVELEFKKDLRDGQFKILDVNPRIWGWHTLSRLAGVDFPYLLWLLANEKPVPELRGCAGKRWMYTSADLRVAFEDIVQGHLSLGGYLRSLRGPLESAIFAWDDPLPAVLDLPLLAWATGKRRLRALKHEKDAHPSVEIPAEDHRSR